MAFNIFAPDLLIRFYKFETFFSSSANNSQHCRMLHVSTFYTPYCSCRLGVVAQSLQPVKLLSKQLPTFLFFPVIAVTWIRSHSFSNIVGATCAHYTWSPAQSLMGCILLTMHCKSEHCWELLHPFARTVAHFNGKEEFHTQR